MVVRPVLVGLLVLAATAAPAAAAPGRWTLVGRPAGSSGNVGLLRTADFRLHAAWLRDSPTGGVLTDTAFSDASATRTRTMPGGQQTVLVSDESTEPPGLRAFSVAFAGSGQGRIVTATAGLTGPWADGGIAASGPDILPGSTVVSATRTFAGSYLLAWSDALSFTPQITSTVEVQPGIGAVPVALGPGEAANVATENGSGRLGVAWCAKQPRAATVDPATGARSGPIRVMPGATRCTGASRTPFAARRGGNGGNGGLFALGAGRRESLRLWRVGAARSVLVTRDAPPFQTLTGAPAALAAARAGRLWVAWSTPGPHGRVAVKLRRTGSSPRRLGAVTTVPIPRTWSHVKRLDVAADANRIEILAVVTRNGNEVGLLHARAEPSLSVAVRPRRFAHGRPHRIHVRVTDAGVPVAGARLRVAGHRARTRASGRAVVHVPAFGRPRPVRLVARKPFYAIARVRLRAR